MTTNSTNATHIFLLKRLLDILAKRKDPKGLKDGKVLYNGDKPPSNLRLMSGYVVQVNSFPSISVYYIFRMTDNTHKAFIAPSPWNRRTKFIF